MSLWSSLRLDKPATGTHYADRMRAILGACSAMALIRIDRASGARHALVTAGEIVAPAGGFVERYGLRVHPSALQRVLGMARVFASALNVATVTVEQEGAIVWVVVPVPQAGALTFERAWDLAPRIPVGHVLLGITPSGDQLTLNLARDYHAAVIGMTGSGKSTLVKTMILSAQLIGHAEIALFDPRGEWAALSGHPCTWQSGRFERLDDIEACLRYLSAQARHNDNARRLYIFVDEVRGLIHERPAILGHLDTLASEGRHAGMHLILCSQQATGATGVLLGNIGARLVGRTGDAMKAAAAAGHGRTGAGRVADPGRFDAIVGDSVVHFQAAMPSAAELSRLCPYPPRYGVAPDIPDGQQFTPNASTPASRGAIVASAIGDPGRTPDDLPPHVRHAIVDHWRKHGKGMSKYRMGALLGHSQVDNDKHDRWLDESLGERWRR